MIGDRPADPSGIEDLHAFVGDRLERVGKPRHENGRWGASEFGRRVSFGAGFDRAARCVRAARFKRTPSRAARTAGRDD